MKVRKVLVFPAGTEIGLEINEALKHCKEIELFGAGQAISNHALFAYERFHELPSIHEPNWLEALSTLCRKLSIDYIFPAYDDVVVALAREQSNIPAIVLTAPLQTCLVTRSKRATYQTLQSVVRVPKLLDMPVSSSEYPVFVKPDRGQGSQGVAVVRSPSELAAAVAALTDPMVCEYLPGDEYTVDCFSDRDQGLLFAGPRMRRRMRNGIAVNTSSATLTGVEVMARKIGSTLQMRGAWFFQVKYASDGELALLEVAPRIAGSMSTHRVMGVNFPLLSIFEHERAPIHILINQGTIELDRALRNRFQHHLRFSTMYIDLDDTLILRKKINLDAISLVFQCLNRGIKVKLLTRHAHDLSKTLEQYRMTALFDEIIHLRLRERKSDFILESDAIFVDDSFAERSEVSARRGIKTFDCSMIELLLNSQYH